MFVCGRGRFKCVWLCVRMKVRVCEGYLSRKNCDKVREKCYLSDVSSYMPKNSFQKHLP